MKRFITIVTIILMLFVVLFARLFTENNKTNAYYNFTATEDAILIRNGNDFEPFIPNGVSLTATQPGVIPSGNEVTYETYLEWFRLMQEMGLNCIKVDALMPSKFYKALETYNNDVDVPLYLIQGIYFDEVALKDGYSPLDEQWKKAFMGDIKAAIDAVHGNAKVFESIYLFKSDHVDVSKYVLGFIIGVNWGPDDISYSNAIYDLSPFKGDYFCSSANANSFEIYLAELLDYAVVYEVDNYARQSLYSIHSHGGRLAQSLTKGDAINEPYDQIRNHPIIDAEHITTTDELKTGFYVNYDIEQVDYEIHNYAVEGEDRGYFEGLDYLLDYHTIPVIISAYGIPTGRFTAEYTLNEANPFIDEIAQSDRTVQQYKRIRESGVSGQFLRDWQDAWFKSSWYSHNLKVLDHSVLWRDIQTYAQGYGVIAFDSTGDVTHKLDDSLEDWHAVKNTIQTNHTTYKIDNDALAVHVLIESDESIAPDSLYYIGLDITPDSGTTHVEEFDLNFEKAIDFLLIMDPNNRQELLVHDYYDVNGFRLLRDEMRRYPDRYTYEKDSATFNPIYQYNDDDALYFKFKELDENDLRLTGKLLYGNNNPTADNYLSTSDWYMTENAIELQLPYGLLNFMSPASKMVFDDFHEHHIFTMKKIDGIYVEFAEVHKDVISYTQPYYYTWDDWTTPTFDMRQKPIFDALKNVMKGE